MNYKSIFILLCFIFFGLNSFSQKQSQLKVMTYNIWNGFDWGKDTIRHNKMIEWIKSQNPDVLALQELCAYTDQKLQEDAKAWGHSYSVLLKTKGYSVGLTSKKPIVLKEKLEKDLWHGLLHCQTYEIDFFVVHLSPSDYKFRQKEANIISQKILDAQVENFIILGDFNAMSPFDGEKLKQEKNLLNKYAAESSGKNTSNLSYGEFDYSVMSKFLAIPTIDVAQKFISSEKRFSFPTPALFQNSKIEVYLKEDKERLDYILCNPSLATKCKNVSIFNSGKTEYLSDHFPVMAEFIFE